MSLSFFLLRRSLDSVGLEAFDVEITPNLSKLNGTSIYITDARRVGLMLRDSRLTLRNHAALTRMVIEKASDEAGEDIILSVPSAAAPSKNYIQLGSKNAFYANADREHAQKFQLKVTELGTELYLEGQRPAVFDDFYDVSVGKWQTGLSPIPLLVHMDVAKIWKGFEPGESVGAAGGAGGANGGYGNAGGMQ